VQKTAYKHAYQMFKNSVIYKGQIRERVYFHPYELC
jgi:hypothetical protein